MTYLNHLKMILKSNRPICVSLGLVLIFWAGCLEEPIPYDLSETELFLDTLSISSMQATTYRTPPELGSSETLHLGKKNGFASQFVLIKISSRSMYPYVDINTLDDSTVTVDSSFMIFTYDKDTMDIAPTFRLSYFPNSSDSLFSENNSNYLNLAFSDLSVDAVTIGDTILVQEAADTSGEQSPPYLKFSIPSSVMQYLDDTSNVNYTFMLTAVDSLETLVGFESDEAANEPQLTVFYQIQVTDTISGTVSIDSTSSIYSTESDLSFLEPPGITMEDTTTLAIGRANGLKVLLQLGIDSLDVPPVTTIRKAILEMHVSADDSAAGMTVIGYPLADSVVALEFFEAGSDDYSTLTDYFISGSVSGNKLKLDLKNYIQAIVFGRISNYGIKLHSSLTNDEFDLVHLSKSEGDTLAPVLKVQYVAP